MLSFSKKWSAPVMFAVLLHVGILGIFYINFSEKDEYKDGHSKDITTEHTSVPRAPSMPVAIKAQASISTVDDSKTPSQVYKKQRINKELPDKSKPKTIENSLKIDVINNESMVTDLTKPNTIPTQKQQLSDKKWKGSRDSSAGFIGNKKDKLENFKNEAGLLSIDTSKQPLAIPTNENYELAKTEVEEINRQLSNAINEVKKRNQQEIDQLQQQQSDIYIRNNENNNVASDDFE
ncbi:MULTISPECIES: hypothetical protein [unclassified Psychrobacter]|uniref:hypothetical protein n=1 Tax=unclassified Psychrobacter TaxID=196806 RepID=UPI0025DAAF5E|nr:MULTISPECIES: hypothetical protein [unclassified Psychrobacter]